MFLGILVMAKFDVRKRSGVFKEVRKGEFRVSVQFRNQVRIKVLVPNQNGEDLTVYLP